MALPAASQDGVWLETLEHIVNAVRMPRDKVTVAEVFTGPDGIQSEEIAHLEQEYRISHAFEELEGRAKR